MTGQPLELTAENRAASEWLLEQFDNQPLMCHLETKHGDTYRLRVRPPELRATHALRKMFELIEDNGK